MCRPSHGRFVEALLEQTLRGTITGITVFYVGLLRNLCADIDLDVYRADLLFQESIGFDGEKIWCINIS